MRAGEPERGLALLDSVGQLDTKWPELMALRDKANLAIGYAHLQAGEPAAARARARARATLRVRSPARRCSVPAGPMRRRSSTKPRLLPWQELQGRNLLDAAVQESYLAVPYAYAELGAMAQAVEYYERAIAAYDAERARIGESIGAIRSGHLLAAAMKAGGDGREGWFAPARDAAGLAGIALPLSPARGHTNSRKASRTTARSTRWPGTCPPGPDSLGAFSDMVETRQQAFEQKLPAADARLATVDVATINGRRDALQAEFEAAVAARDVAALATAKEREQLAMLDAVDAELARPAADASYDLSHANGMGGGGGPRLRTSEVTRAKRRASRAACCCGSSTPPGKCAPGRRAARSAT